MQPVNVLAEKTDQTIINTDRKLHRNMRKQNNKFEDTFEEGNGCRCDRADPWIWGVLFLDVKVVYQSRITVNDGNT